MKKFVSMLCLTLVFTMILATIAFAACDGKGRSYNVDCWKTFGTYQYAKATQSASCTGGHKVTLTTKLKLHYTDGTTGSASGTSSVQKQVPAGKVGSKASGTFNAKCSAGYNFPQRSATDTW